MAPESTPTVRPSAIAGRWYPGNATSLRRDIEGYFKEAATRETHSPLPGRIIGVIAPHAGYAYSGPTAGRAFAVVRGAGFSRVVVVGPLHRPIWGSPVGPYMVPIESAYRTPLGDIPVDHSFIGELDRRLTLTRVERDEEHALEIELPFLQVALGQFTLVPIMLGEHIAHAKAADGIAALSEVLAELLDEQTLLVSSTDLSHMENYADVVRTDRVLVDLVQSFDVAGLRTALRTETVQACGATGLLTVMEACGRRGARGAQVLQYTNSGEVTGEKRPGSYTVGYLAAAIYA